MKSAEQSKARKISGNILFLAIFLLAGILASYPFFHKKKIDIANKKVEQLVSDIANYKDKDGVLQDSQYMERLQTANDSEHTALLELMNIARNSWQENTGVLEFQQDLHNTRLALQKSATANGISLVADFGFRNEFPAEEDVRLYTKSLHVIRCVLPVFIKSKVKSIDKITLYPLSDYVNMKVANIQMAEIEVGFSFVCGVESLVEVLQAISNSQDFLLVNKLSIKKVKKELAINFKVNKLFFVEK
jgi:hypothetical protein